MRLPVLPATDPHMLCAGYPQPRRWRALPRLRKRSWPAPAGVCMGAGTTGSFARFGRHSDVEAVRARGGVRVTPTSCATSNSPSIQNLRQHPGTVRVHISAVHGRSPRDARTSFHANVIVPLAERPRQQRISAVAGRRGGDCSRSEMHVHVGRVQLRIPGFPCDSRAAGHSRTAAAFRGSPGIFGRARDHHSGDRRGAHSVAHRTVPHGGRHRRRAGDPAPRGRRRCPLPARLSLGPFARSARSRMRALAILTMPITAIAGGPARARLVPPGRGRACRKHQEGPRGRRS